MWGDSPLTKKSQVKKPTVNLNHVFLFIYKYIHTCYISTSMHILIPSDIFINQLYLKKFT